MNILLDGDADWEAFAKTVNSIPDKLNDANLQARMAEEMERVAPVYASTIMDGRRQLLPKTAGKLTGWRSYLAIPRRISTFEEAEELRLDYRRFYDWATRHTERSQRHSFLEADHEADENGHLWYDIEGQVVDWRGGAWPGDKHVYRICLLFPHAVNADGSKIPIDSHLWLPLRDCGYPHVNRILPHNEHPGMRLKIHLGDTLKLRGVLCMYEGAHGLKRMGISTWYPIDSRLRYLQRYADGRMVERAVPTKIDDCLALAWIPESRSVLRRRNAAYMDVLFEEASARHPGVEYHGFVTERDWSGYPLVARDQQLLLSRKRGVGRLRIV